MTPFSHRPHIVKRTNGQTKGNGHNGGTGRSGPHAESDQSLNSTPKRKKGKWLWKKGQSGNPKGPGPHIRTVLQAAKLRIMARTGMMPLDFMTAVYRNELYEEYDQRVAEDGRTLYFTPRTESVKIEVPVQMRLAAAAYAAPYVHRKMPVGLELQGRNAMGLTAERLRELSGQELTEMLRLMDKLGVAVDVSGASMMDESGRLLSAPSS